MSGAGRGKIPFGRGGAVAVAVTMAVGAGGVAVAAGVLGERPGRQADGGILLPTGQTVTPRGRQVEFPGRPIAVALRPDGKTATVLNAAGRSLVVIDIATGTVKQQFTPQIDRASYAGLVYSADGDQLYASQASGSIAVAEVADDGALSLAARVELPQEDGNPYPGGLALSKDGEELYVALSRDNALGVIDLETRQLTARIPVGNAPHAVVVAAGKAYVTNQGGRRPDPGEPTNDSSGTPVVADAESGSAASGTVSVVDLAARRVERSVDVGLHPTEMALHGRRLFVTNTNSDTLSVIDTARDDVVKTIEVKPFPRAPFGSSPNEVTMLGDDRLLVSLGRNNALAVYRYKGDAEAVRFEGLVPTGGYPASLAVDDDTQRVIVANNTGLSTAGAPGVGQNTGSASILRVPKRRAQLAHTTRQVYDNNDWTKLRGHGVNRPEKAEPVPVPLKWGQPSTIKHVFYIIKENRTYDQVLGDVDRGEGDPSFATFGGDVTPNHHKLAEQFPLLDNT